MAHVSEGNAANNTKAKATHHLTRPENRLFTSKRMRHPIYPFQAIAPVFPVLDFPFGRRSGIALNSGSNGTSIGRAALEKTKVALMGFGRIGRNVFRLLAGHPFLEVGVIADVADPVGLAYLLKYDTIYGRFPGQVTYADGALLVEEQRTPIIAARHPGDADWKEMGISLVVQATGRHRTMEECRRHIAAGARGVTLASTPLVLDDIPILLSGVNDHLLAPDTEVIALGSNTSNALAPILCTLADSFGLRRGFFTSVHAITNAQRLADVPTSGFRSSRAAADNIIPSPTRAAEILTSACPEFAGKLSGLALNVPVADGSTVDLVAELETPVDPDSLNRAMQQACDTRYRGIVEYSTDPIVSSDVTGASESAVFDSLATMVIGEHLTKTVTWYNNGWGYSARIVEVLEKMSGA